MLRGRARRAAYNRRPMTTNGARFRYGWLVLAVAAFVVSSSARGTRAAPGALLLSMRDDTGWSTADIAIAGAAGLLLLGLAGPASGVLIDRFGVRRRRRRARCC